MTSAKKLLQDFYLISGMRIALYDKQKRCVAWAGPTAHSYCNAVHGTAQGLSRCSASDEAAFLCVQKTQKTHTLTCPFGLFEAVAPVFSKGMLQGYLFIGEAITAGQEHAQNALKKGLPFTASGTEKKTLHALITQLATHTPSQQEALVNTLALFASAPPIVQALDSAQGDIAVLLRDYLEHNYAKRITLQELALHFHYSSVTLTERFKKTFATTVRAFLSEKRITAAKELLRTTQMPIAAVGAACGFENPEHFSKVFKKHTGLPPAHFRAHAEP